MNLDAALADTVRPPPPVFCRDLKQCACGAVYTPGEWLSLKYVGQMDDGDGGWLELRNCVCGSTIAVAK